MKTSALVLIFLTVATFAFGQEMVNVTVDVEGMLNRKGDLSITVYNNPDDYLKNPVKHLTVELGEYDGSTFEITDLPKGKYAIVVLHDENRNGELDFGGMGPVEGYGFSNNPDSMFGPAKYEEALLLIEKDSNIIIRLN